MKYDKSLLEKAEDAASDGQVSFAEAKELWEAAADGPGLTDIERATLQYCLKTYKFTEKAANYLKKALSTKRTGSYYKVMDGVRYDRELYEMAEKYVADGQISGPEAKALWKQAEDGPGVTDIESRTLLYVLKNFKCTAPAIEFLNAQLKPKKEGGSYYKQVDGVRYDRELYEMAEEAAKDGQVSYPEAKQLWDSAMDGPGVTDIEKRTLQFALTKWKFTNKAAEYLQGRLATLEKPPPAPPTSPGPVTPQTMTPPPSPVRPKKPLDAAQAIGLIDHTSLGDKDTEETIKALVDAAVAKQPHTAAVCVLPKFVASVRKLQASNASTYPRTLKVATVVNFPTGKEPIDKVLADTKKAVADGADEIDMVIDYQAMKEDMAAGATKAEFLVRQVRRACEDAKLKVIIEAGELKTEELILAATTAACSGNADFVKTSTGKATNSNLDQAKVMLEMIAQWNKAALTDRVIGFKASGGVSTADLAQEYMLLTAKYAFGSEDKVGQVTPQHLRLGSSSLLPVLRAQDNGASTPKRQKVQ